MTNEEIKDLALANGFKLKVQPSGFVDLNPYVYDFARALLAAAAPAQAEPMKLVQIRNVALEEAAQIADYQYQNTDGDPVIENVNVAMRNCAAAIRERILTAAPSRS